MRIAVVGAGAIGGYFGGRLAQAGFDVAFVARGLTLAALERDGLRLESPRGDLHLPTVEADSDPARLRPADAVIVAVKAWQVPVVARQIPPLLTAESCVLPLQNGIDAPAELAREVGEGRVLGGLCRIAAQVERPGVIRHLGAEPTIVLGELDDRPSERVESLRDALEQAGVVAEIPASIEGAMWEKLLLISAISTLGAATRMPLGVLRSDPDTRRLLEELMEEIRAVATAKGIPVDDEAVGKTMAFLDTLPEESTASMQRDVMAGRPSELEAQTGAVVRHGREAGVATPLHEILYRILRPLEARARSEAASAVRRTS